MFKLLKYGLCFALGAGAYGHAQSVGDANGVSAAPYLQAIAGAQYLLIDAGGPDLGVVQMVQGSTQAGLSSGSLSEDASKLLSVARSLSSN